MYNKCFVNGCVSKVTQTWKSSNQSLQSCDLHKPTSSKSSFSSTLCPNDLKSSSSSIPSLFLLLLFLPLCYLSLDHYLSLQLFQLSLISQELSSLTPSPPSASLIKKLEMLSDHLTQSNSFLNLQSNLHKNSKMTRESFNSFQALPKAKPLSYREVLLILSDQDTSLSNKIDLLGRFFGLVFEDEETEVLTFAPLQANGEIAAGTMSGNIHYIDLYTQSHRIVYKGKARVYQIVPFKMFGSAIVTGDARVNIVTLPQFHASGSFIGHNHWVISCNFSPNELYMVTGSCDRLVKVWHSQSMTLAFNLTGHTADVWSVSFDPKGSLIASAGEDKNLIIWDFWTQKLLKVFKGHTASIYCLQFTSDSNYILTGSFDGTIRIWSLTTTENEKVLPHKGMVRSIKLIKNDTILLSISGKSLKIWNMADFQVIKELWHSGTLISLTISQDNEFIITGDIFGRIWVWELSSLSLKTVFSGAKSKIHRVEISEDFEWLAIGDIGLVRIYSLVLIQQVAALQLKSEVEAWKRLINLEGFLPYLK